MCYKTLLAFLRTILRLVAQKQAGCKALQGGYLRGECYEVFYAQLLGAAVETVYRCVVLLSAVTRQVFEQRL